MAGESLQLKMLIEAVNKTEAALKSTQEDLKKVQEQIDKTSESSKRSSEAFQKSAVIFAAAGAAAVVALKGWLDAAIEQERAETRLNTLLKNVTGTTQENIQALKDQASALQQVGVVGDEATMVGQSQLATFALQAKTIEMLTPAMLDLTVATKGVNATQEDMINIGNLVGKVMQGQIGALSRVGVTFNEAQGEILKTGTEMEKAAILAEILEQNFGGLNEAMRETTEGQLVAAKNAWGDFKELLGAQLIPIVASVTSVFTGLVAFLSGLSPQTQTIIVAITGVIAVFGLLAGAIAGVMAILPSLTAAFAVLTGPIGLVSVAIAGMALIWNENLGGIQEKTLAVIGIVIETFEMAKTTIKGIIDSIAKNFNISANEMLAIAGGFIDGVKNLFEIGFGLMFEIVSGIFNVMKALIQSTLEIIGGIINTAINLIKGNWGAAWESFKGVFISAWEGMTGFLTASVNVMIGGINKIIDAINKLPGVAIPNLNKIGDAADDVANRSISAISLAQKAVAGADRGGLPAKQFGGFVKANKPVLVGENGPEIFTPQSTGNVTPNNRIGGDVQIGNLIGTVIINNEADEDRLVEKIKFMLSRDMQLQKLGSQS